MKDKATYIRKEAAEFLGLSSLLITIISNIDKVSCLITMP